MTLCLLALSAVTVGAAGLQYSAPEKVEGISKKTAEKIYNYFHK